MDKYKISLEILKDFEGFDEAAFATLAAETSEEVASSILHEFRHTLHECSLIFSQTIGDRNPDLELLSKTCHRIKGSSKLLGFVSISDHSEIVKMSLKKSEPRVKWGDFLEAFQKECLLFQAELDNIYRS